MKKVILLAVMAFFLIQASHAQDPRFKALITYNFNKFIKWNDASGDFVICVLGGSAEVLSEFDDIADKKTANSQKITIAKANSVAEIVPANILYIASGHSDKLAACLAKTPTNTLVVTGDPGQTSKGAGISFIAVDGTWKFEFSEANIKKQGLGIANDLNAIGIKK